ncbi:DNA-binding protein WhiA [Mycolicibacterium sp.]|uniref:DNA-binding protein WhiA n=1 Tax=Mycolicibacterium sp. TaxID=2320850 RepID=UPI00355F9BDC
MTAQVRDELSRTHTNHAGCRRAQLATALRLSSELRVRRGLVVAAEVHTAAVARYLRREIAALHDLPAAAHVLPRDEAIRGGRYAVRVDTGGGPLARATGLIDERGRPVAGLPTLVVGGSAGEVAAAWRGAFLVAGSLSGPGRSAMLEVRCPSTEAAYALASCARRLGVVPLVRETHGVDRVIVRDVGDIAKLLTRMGATASVIEWERRSSRQHLHRWANLDDANTQRAESAAAENSTRVERALAILGDAAPTHLADTAMLRIMHEKASLEELGRFSEPPLTKDAVAGRLRRLLALADKHAEEAGAGQQDQNTCGARPASPTLVTTGRG